MPTIRPRSGGFQAQVRMKQNGVVVFQDSATFPTRKAAEYWGLSVESSIARTGIAEKKAEQVTVRQLLEMYSTAREKVKKLGRGFEHSMNAVAYSNLGKLPASRLTSGAVSDWAMSLHAKGNAPATVMHHLSILRAAINAAPALFDLHVDPEPVKLAIAKLKVMRIAGNSEKRDRRPTEAELDAICAYLKTTPSVQVPTWDYVRLAVALPRRLEELTTAKWAHLDTKLGVLRLLDTKNPRKMRNETVPVPPEAMNIFNRLPRTDERILPYKPQSISAAFQRAVRKLGIEDLRLHDLRHEGISRLFEAGLRIEEVALVSGHTSWATLKRYTHLRPEQVTTKLKEIHAGRQRQKETSAQPEQPRENNLARPRRKAN